ncbi:MAG: hypothetical protein GDA44_15690 [Prochloron sp. SP5CPC1]|nr:hypothetical protein [Candidatus Paraprochloron terpiosi SP5CPC1]
MNTNKHLLKTYTADSGRKFKQTTMVNHKGTVVALAMDNQRQIYYTVLNLADTQETSPLDVNYWLDNPQPLEFAEEIVQVGYGIADPTLMPLVKKGSQEEVNYPH